MNFSHFFIYIITLHHSNHSGQFQPQPPGGMNPGPPGMAPNFSAPGAPPPGMGAPGMSAPGMGAPGMGMEQPGGMGGGFHTEVDFCNTIPSSMFRPTTTMIATSAAMASACKAPSGGVLRPFANVDEGQEVSIVHPGAAGIIRCKRCRTYVNAFVSWMENGRRWRCNICGQSNETASAYFCHLDERNQRRDAAQRPELSQSVVEWVAPSEYMVRPPQPPAYFFVLDVSVNAVRSGMLTAAANAIKNALDDLPGGDRTMVGFITFDSAVHYYALKPGSSNPQMMVVGDLKELFVPAPDDLLVYLKDSREAVENLLDNLPTMFTSNTVTESCLGPALKAAFTVVKSVGGKMCVFQSAMPTLGDGALGPRENNRLMGTPDEVKILRPQSTWYKDTAVEFSRAQISVDMFLFPSQYIDVAALCELPKVTAGTMKSYVGFDLARDGPKFESDLTRRLTQKTAFEAVLRIRCTKGMRISNFYGNFFIRGTDLLALPNCTMDSVFGFDLVHDEQSINSPYVTIQSALLYTTSEGERRIRVATQVLKTTSRNSELMASVDAEACAALLSKQAMSVGIKTNLDNARNRLQQTCVDMINAAKGGDKRTVSGYSMPSQQGPSGDEPQKIPPNLELLPLYTLALLKNVAFRGGTDVHPDERLSAHMSLSSMFVEDTLSFIHPRLYSIHNMASNAGMPSDDDVDDDTKTAGRNKIILPSAVGLSVERLSSEGVFLMNNGPDTFLWVGRAANPATVSALFGAETIDGVDISQVKLISSGNDIASRLDCIIQALHEESDNSLPANAPRIQIIREGDVAMEGRFFWNFIEDRAQFNGGTFSYEDFMAFVNRPPGSGGGPPAPPGRGPMPPPGPGPRAPSMRGGIPGGPPPPMNAPAPHTMTGGPPPPNAGPAAPGPPPPMGAPVPPSSAPIPGRPMQPRSSGPPPPRSGGFGGPPPPSQMQPPPGSGGFGGPPPPASGGYGGPPPPSSGGYGGPPPPSSGGYGGPPPPSSGGYGGPPPPQPPNAYGNPPPPQQYGMPPPPR